MTLSRGELQDAARRAFGGDLAPDAAASWTAIAGMGWLMMAVPEAQAGLGLGHEAIGVIHTELGRTLVPGPAIAQIMVIEALSGADDVAGRDGLLARAMAGEVMTASLSMGGAFDAVLDAVPDADLASHVLVVEADHVRLAPLDPATATRQPTWDTTRRLFAIAPPAGGITLASGAAAGRLAARIEARLLLALAADALGGARAILDRTIDYLKVRRQFGRPLAMFQALKHRVADLTTRLAAADALFWSCAADASVTVTRLGALKAHATGTYRAIAEDAIQLHGGIGLTMEHPCHLFLKRATLDAALGGDADYWEERAGREVLNATR